MATLADLERLLEQVFERTSARLFRTRIQPVQLEHRVERAMERARDSSGGRTIVPGQYRVRVNPADLADVAPSQPEAAALAGRLADAALAFARGHAYHLPARPVVVLMSDPSLDRGHVEVDVASQPAADVPSAMPPPVVAAGGYGFVFAGAATPAALPGAGGARPIAGIPGGPIGGPVPAGPDPMGEVAGDGIRGDGTQTLVYRRPAPPAARAVVRVTAPDGRERTVEVDAAPLTVGRAKDSGLLLPDPRVSRVHGRLQTRRGALVYTDLGSTNGSRVNGIRVDEIALGMGDRVQLGDTILVVESLPG